MRSSVSTTSRMACFWAVLRPRWATIVSARRDGSSSPETDDRISDGTFRLTLTYCSNCETSERLRASISPPPGACGRSRSTSASKWDSISR